MIKKMSLIFLASAAFVASGLCGAEVNGKYQIVQAGDRVFLLNNQTGDVWRFFFNTQNEQGWSRTYFISIGDTENEASLNPSSPTFKYKR